MFDDVCNLVHLGHAKGVLTPQGTLNRLFHDHLTAHKPEIADNPPRLSPDNTIVILEHRPKLAIRALAPRSESRPPRNEGCPVVIVNYRGADCLIDGGSRAHKWFETRDAGLHPANLVIVLDRHNTTPA